MDSLKLVLDVLIKTYNAYTTSTANGQKLTFASLFTLGPVFMALPKAINAFNDAVKEAGALTDETAAELEQYIVSQLPQGSDQLSKQIVLGLDAVFKGAAAVQDVVAIFKVPAAVVASVPVAKIPNPPGH